MSENVGTSTSRNPKGLRGLYMDNFTFNSTEQGPSSEGNLAQLAKTLVDFYDIFITMLTRGCLIPITIEQKL
jgi:hypothetical protein